MQAINLLAIDSEIVSQASIEKLIKQQDDAEKERKKAEKLAKKSQKTQTKSKSSKKQQQKDSTSDVEGEGEDEGAATAAPGPGPPSISGGLQDPNDYSLDDPAKGDSLVPVVGGMIRRDKEALLKAMESKRDLQDEVRRAIVSILLRMARRTYWAYMRQLWDEHYVELVAADAKDEIVHRTAFFMSRGIERSEVLRSQLEITSQKLKREFGSEFSASSNVDIKLGEYTTEVFDRKKQLREYVTDVSNATGLWVDTYPKDAYLDLGIVGVILTDLNWGWLLPDGVIKDLALSAKEVGIHFSVFDALQQALGGVAGSKDQDSEGDGSSERG